MTFEETYQQYLDESNPDYHSTMESLFRWFYDKGYKVGLERAAVIAHSMTDRYDCQPDIAAAIREEIEK